MYRYFFKPTILDKIITFLLLPLSLIYYLITIYKKRKNTFIDFNMKIISIGNIVSGGSGKTPFCISLVNNLILNEYKNIFVVLRGYGRESKGLLVVGLQGKILTNVKSSGDEAMLIAQKTKANVIVSEDRVLAIRKAKEMGAEIIILDDGYRFNFKKFDILLKPRERPYFNFVLPSGYYRFPPSYYAKCDLCLEETKDYYREVQVLDPTKKMLLITGIATPQRLEYFLKDYEENIVGKIYLKDHANLIAKRFKKLYKKYDAHSVLVTQKDYVKCGKFDLKFSILDMNLIINDDVLEKIYIYLNS